MYWKTSNLVLYRPTGILAELTRIFWDWEQHHVDSYTLISRIHEQVGQLIELSTRYGFEGNLWHSYLSYVLATNENSFSMLAERRGMVSGSIREFAKRDFQLMMDLFHFDFAPIEKDLEIDCFSALLHYQAAEEADAHSMGGQIQSLSRKLAGVTDADCFLHHMEEFYQSHGVGIFGLNQAFHVRNLTGQVEFLPVKNTDKIRLEDLVGYELQKKELVYNTEAFLRHKPCNNALLYGDAGTGKSSSIKALANRYYSDGLRLIEIYKHQFGDLSAIIGAIKNRNYRFIIFIDDLSFEENEVEYKFLKAVIEGSTETKPDNVLIYATSNRRHLIKETWKDKNDMEYQGEIHRSDTMEEKLSLAGRFGVTINFNIPNRQQYHEMILTLASRQLKTMPERQELLKLADRWEIRHGGVSGRTAQQFINYLSGKE